MTVRGIAMASVLGLAACAGGAATSDGTRATTADSTRADSTRADTAAASPSPADAVIEAWTEALGGQYRAAAALDEAAFIAQWDADIDAWRAQLDAAEAPPIAYERIRYEWAFGRLLYPVLHSRLTGEPRAEPSPAFTAYLDAVELDRGDLLALEEYTAFIGTMAEMRADDIFAAPDFAPTGDAHYLDAKIAAAMSFENPAIQCHLELTALEYWREDFDADGLRDQADVHAARCPSDRADALVAEFAAERAKREDHDIEVFKTVDGFALDAHIFRPEDASAPAPAIIWLHGGGWFFGSWDWCGPCVYFKERGHVVIQLDYRIRGRHSSFAGDSLEDAKDAVAWVRANAERLGVDPNRVGVSGFSAGAHLSMAAGAFAPAGDPRRPDLVASFSGCADMTLDDYMTRMAGGPDQAKALSPGLIETPSSPPAFIANARRDTDCRFDAAERYAANLTAAGQDVVFHDAGELGHFFLRDADAAAAAKAALYTFLDDRGW